MRLQLLAVFAQPCASADCNHPVSSQASWGLPASVWHPGVHVGMVGEGWSLLAVATPPTMPEQPGQMCPSVTELGAESAWPGSPPPGWVGAAGWSCEGGSQDPGVLHPVLGGTFPCCLAFHSCVRAGAGAGQWRAQPSLGHWLTRMPDSWVPFAQRCKHLWPPSPSCLNPALLPWPPVVLMQSGLGPGRGRMGACAHRASVSRQLGGGSSRSAGWGWKRFPLPRHIP